MLWVEAQTLKAAHPQAAATRPELLHEGLIAAAASSDEHLHHRRPPLQISSHSGGTEGRQGGQGIGWVDALPELLQAPLQIRPAKQLTAR